MTIALLHFHTVFPVSLHSSRRASAFKQTDIDLAIYRQILLALMKKTYQFVSWIPKPKMQEELVATLRLQLAVNRIN